MSRYACCDVRSNPRVILSIHNDRDAAWAEMDRYMTEQPELPGGVSVCPPGKEVGDTLTLDEIMAVISSEQIQGSKT